MAINMPFLGLSRLCQLLSPGIVQQEGAGSAPGASGAPLRSPSIVTSNSIEPDVAASASSNEAAATAAEKKQPWVEERPAFSLCSSPVKENSDAKNDGAPNGGLRAWLVVAGAFINFMIAFGLLNVFGSFQYHYQKKWEGASTATITWIGSIQLFLLFLGGLFVGPAFDKYGSQRLLSLGTLSCVAAFVLTSWSTDYWHYLLAQGFLFGAGNALLFYPTTGAISEWFDEKRGLALGMAVSGSSIGGIFWPIVINKLFNEASEAVAHRVITIISTPCMIISCFLIRQRQKPASHEECNKEAEAWLTTLSKAVLERRFLTLCCSLMILFTGMLIPFYYIPLYAQEHGTNGDMANNLLAITYAGSFFSRIGAGWLADRFGRFNVLSSIGICMGVTTVCWLWMTSLGAMIAFTILFGTFSGGVVPLGSACVAQTTCDWRHLGLRIGVMMAFCSIGALAGGPISGMLKDGGGGWPAVLVFASAAAIVGSLMLLAVRFWYQPRPWAKF